jgi:protein phosphatase
MFPQDDHRQVFRCDTGSAIGARTINADAAAVCFATPERPVFAVADGVGDTEGSARAARLATTTAADVAARVGPVRAVLAAQRALRDDPAAGDCVLVVATAEPHCGRFRIAWAGDARAWAWRSGELHQLTMDHTLAEYFRVRGQNPAPALEHLVTVSVRTAREEEIGRTEAHCPEGLLLTSDGVHKPLDRPAMGAVLRHSWHGGPATALVAAAIDAGGTDNATALLIMAGEPSPDAVSGPGTPRVAA